MFFTWVRSRNYALIVGLVSVAIAMAFMVFGEFYNKPNLIDVAQWLASIGVAITSLGIAAHSIIISKESDKKLLALANKSDEKMKSRIRLFRIIFRKRHHIPHALIVMRECLLRGREHIIQML